MTREEKLEQFGPGPWIDEPDRLEWQAEGFVCLIVRNDLGTLCGYVGVPEGHPWFEQPYTTIDADVHGGVSHGDYCHGLVCHHTTEPDAESIVWWVGFDTGHLYDFMPRVAVLLDSIKRDPEMQRELADLRSFETYRDLDFVRTEVERLAKQARVAHAQ